MAKVNKEDWKSTPDSDEEAKRERGEQSVPEFEHESLAVRLLFDKLNEAIDLSNSQVDTIALNTAKTGITNAQASAISLNTAKKGVSSAQETVLGNAAIARFKSVQTNNNKITADVSLIVVISKTSTTLQTAVTLSSGEKFSGTLATLTKAGK